MTPANPRAVELKQTTAEQAAARRTYDATPDERSNPRLNAVPRRPHLDVDAVLARSIPRVAGE